MTTLAQRYQIIQQQLQAYPAAKMIAVSKYTDIDHIRTLSQLGHKAFGESRPQQLRDRALLFPELEFHMIGPLQKNKAKYIGRHAHMWHSLTDLEIAHKVDQHVSRQPLATLLQINLSDDPNKHGIAIEDLAQTYHEACTFKHLEIKGLMCMAPKNQNARKTFQILKTLLCHIVHEKMPIVSMGMSGDYSIALEEGTNLIRLGRALFHHEGRNT